MKCRVCGCGKAQTVGTYRPYLDYEVTVFDCLDCGSRFVPRDEFVYEELHKQGGGRYLNHDRWAQLVHAFFQRHDATGIGRVLKRLAEKNRFIIDTIDGAPSVQRVLECGCSRGYLSAFFLAKEYQVTGVDVSPTAVAAARKLFGDFFVLPDDDVIQRNAPYDAVFHAGTIGCVESPLEFTKNLLSLLRPGGLLVFNSPDVAACHALGTVWVPGTSPPDLVTLFSERFWKGSFSELADTAITFEHPSGFRNVRAVLRKARGIPLLPEPSSRLFERVELGHSVRTRQRKWKNVCGRLVSAPLNALCRARLLPNYPTEGGMFVRMRKT